MEEGNPLHKSDSFTEELGTNLVFQVDKTIFKDAHVQKIDDYKQLHKTSVENPEEFWTEIANQFYWKERWVGKFMEYNFDLTQGDIFINFMKGAKTNICYNVLDRIVLEKDGKDKVAFYWEGNDPSDNKKITYGELLKEVCKFSNVLKNNGVQKGDRVAIYMPMILELVVAMLACARIGVIHSIVFAGFSADSLAERMIDGKCSLLITAELQ